MEARRKNLPRPPGWAFGLVAAAAFAFLLRIYVQAWSPACGLTRFIASGPEWNERGIRAWRDTPKYLDSMPWNRWGFDGQFYAEIALSPLLRDPGLVSAIDDFGYRAHRILLPWLAWMGGLGRPFAVVNAYAALNLVFWVGFAAMMWILFRPCGWPGLAGFAAMLLTCGVVESLRKSLTDFPAWVLMTSALMAGGRAGAGLLALATLAREVSILGIAGLWEFAPRRLENWKENLRLALIAAGPLLIWLGYLAWRIRMNASAAGVGNMGLPLSALIQSFRESLAAARQAPVLRFIHFYRSYELHGVLTVVALCAQCAYVATHPEWRNRIWRAAAIFVPFFLCVGSRVWDDHLNVTRVALPITLAFNLVLAMRPGRLWTVWFLLGNCFLPYPIYDFSWFGTDIRPPSEITIAGGASSAGLFRADFSGGWSAPERSDIAFWRWAPGRKAEMALENSGAKPLHADLYFGALSYVPRDLRVSAGGKAVWSGRLRDQLQWVRTVKFIVQPGETIVDFETPQDPAPADSRGGRPLSFMVSGVRFAAEQAP